ncbi:DUF6916 family protein [Modicisalibacter coralii]|uniref:DUF6916 family protein n=1 Tax=Modicisalibacter coralii TaxID=2304602 RepID=UPI00100AA899|nr:hypothetical protein [Halomonas coralii]
MTDDVDTPAPGIGELDAGRFEAHLEQPFVIESDAIRLAATLVDCRTVPDAAGPDSTRTPFSLLLRADVDENHPLQNRQEFIACLEGLPEGTIEGLLIQRTLRPARRPPGCYFQILFN